MPSNGATQEGTRQFRDNRQKNFHPDKLREIAGLSVSALGLGTYLGGYDDATDAASEESIREAISLGLNFLDTAINYRCQRSERTIGRALKGLIESKKLKRSQVVVATKGGFIPFDGTPPSNLKAYIKNTWIDTGLVSEEDIVASCHCLHPAYIQHQIQASLSNLGLDTIDIYYLHNPETQLPVLGHDAFYLRLAKAFEVLEKNVAEGKIQFYGLATWTAFREPAGAENISLERVVKTAREVAGEGHHFKVIQLPYNLAMLEAISVHGQRVGERNLPIIPAASEMGISVVTSAPLLQSQLLNLPVALVEKIPGDFTLAQKALQFVVSTPSVQACMVGMNRKEHGTENLNILKAPNWDLPTLQKICDVLVRGRGNS
ncbi:MAG: aldo/keto reductase [Deltaproteobacteria bacterium]|nr:aldo/keto reductase [Deltaproteobacteria bacterium]